MTDYGIYHESVTRAQDCIKAAVHYYHAHGSASMTFGHLLKGMLDKSPFISSQMKIAMEISMAELRKVLENGTLDKEDSSIEEAKIIYSDEARNYLDAAQNNANMNGRRCFDEMDIFFAFFLTRPNPLYHFLDHHNIPYKIIFKRQR